MAGGIFINYRRDDSIGTAGRLHDRLVRDFGRKNLFMDVDNVPAGVDFVEYLNSQVGKCDVLLAIIGPNWINAKDDNGCRRLDNPDDFVTAEIAAALQRNIRVIPVLVDGAHLPKADELSPLLRPLVRRQAIEVRNAQFGRDVDGLADRVRESLRVKKARGPWLVATATLASLLFIVGIGWFGLRWIGLSVSVPWPLEASGPTVRGGDFTLAPRQIFRDRLIRGEPCPTCPEMVVVPAGSFTMGSSLEEKGRYENEGPPHQVAIANPFAVGRFPVTRGEFAVFSRETGYNTDGGCNNYALTSGWHFKQDQSWRSPGFEQDDRHPVVCVNWTDGRAFAAWLSNETGKPYRLLTEAEREYAARAGTMTRYYFGDEDKDYCRYGNGADLSAKAKNPDWDVLPCDDRFPYTSPVGSFLPNAFGLYDMLGNVWQWVEDCYNGNYAGAPIDGSAWISGNCELRVIRGGSWLTVPRQRRVATRGSYPIGMRLNHTGFRLARALDGQTNK
jgi:formylglycine-generating enzyme required for sulfatase activity